MAPLKTSNGLSDTKSIPPTAGDQIAGEIRFCALEGTVVTLTVSISVTTT
jgi:hypothetical protein